ncbi:MAG: DUF424 family protein [Nanoarchaeota archaeon]|nr:DUF424 family protein [Nanoarchaeota archaeon]
MQVKIHKSYRDIVSVCDSNLLGKIFEEGERQLDVRESFYEGDEVFEKELLEIMKSFSCEDATFNIVGENSVKCALNAGIITQEGIKEIQGIRFALGLM